MTEPPGDGTGGPDDGVTVGRAARLLGVSPSALRYYDEIGLVPVDKDGSGYRRYRTPQLRAVSVVRAAQELGFTLEEIRRLVQLDPGARDARRELAETKIRQIDDAMITMSTIRAFLEHARSCTCHDASQCQAAVPGLGAGQP
jgi:MerR family redox-sensitive transcriptional activator SoxR